jgi:hypothetical protein
MDAHGHADEYPYPSRYLFPYPYPNSLRDTDGYPQTPDTDKYPASLSDTPCHTLSLSLHV